LENLTIVIKYCGPIGNLEKFVSLNFREIETRITLEITQIESINN